MRRLGVILAVLLGFLTIDTLTFAQTDWIDTLPECGFSSQLAGAQVGAVVVTLQTRNGCIEQLDRFFQGASVPKIFVAGATYEKIARGLASLSMVITFDENYYMAGRNDCLDASRLGQQITVNELLRLMIACSDNATTAMLMDFIGWDYVNQYARRMVGDAVGEILPYAEVDKRKLMILSPEWGAVPRAMASRYYRSGRTDGLDAYFSSVPARLNRSSVASANALYFATATANTLTPRALWAYFMTLRQAMLEAPFSELSIVGNFLFGLLLETQRLQSVQSITGNVIIGGKNGFDRGVVAEISVLFDVPQTRIPSGFVFLFTQQDDLTAPNVQPATYNSGVLNDLLDTFAPMVQKVLFGEGVPMGVVPSFNVSSVVLHRNSTILSCWQSYRDNGFLERDVAPLSRCFRAITAQERFQLNEDATVGITLIGLKNGEAWTVLLFTDPNGRIYSYQVRSRFVDETGIFWYHPLGVRGEWQLSVYVNQQLVAAYGFEVE